MGNFEVLNLEDTLKWKELILKLPSKQKDIYFTPEYYSLYENLGDGNAQCIIYENADNCVLYPCLINSVNELGYNLDKQYYDIQGAYGYNGVVSNDYSEEFINKFYSELTEYCKEKNIIAEFARFHPLLKNHLLSSKNLTVIKDRETVFLDLQVPYDKIWDECYSKKNRNMIRKAKKSGYFTNIISNPSPEKIIQFFDIYTSAMSKIGADEYYFFNSDYLINIFKNLASCTSIFEVLNPAGEVQCSAIVFVYGDFAHYHLSARIYEVDNSVNNIVLDESVKYAILKGAKYFHFGGGTTSKLDDPLLKFKLNFSKQRADFYIGKKIHNQTIYNEVVIQWENKYPEKIDKYNNMVLKYRF